MRTSRWGLVVLFVSSLLQGCFSCHGLDPFPGTGGGAGGGTGGGGFTIEGQLKNGQGLGPDAKVEVKKNGVVIGATDAPSGLFSLSVDPGGPATLVVSVRADGYNPVIRTVKADRTGRYAFEEQVVALLQLACSGTSCTSGGLTVDGLPQGVTGFGRAFNPVTETDAFPGGFDDSDGNLLLSGAFATVELKDAQGKPLTQLSSPAALRMPFPKDTWPLLVDLAAGDGKVTVPLYAFDEALGTWKREGAGELIDEGGVAVPEASIAAVRARTYGGALFVRGQVTHFSTWNVDWPISSHGCVTGRLIAADGGQPQAGAKVEVEGLTYTGRTAAHVTSSDGRFCADVLRSEAPTEDVDGNGVTGETQKVGVYISVGDAVYDGRERTIPTAAASCGGACLDLGDVVLDATSEFKPALCDVSGTLVEQDGTPISGLRVSGYSTATSEEVQAICPDFSCYGLNATTVTGGAFSGRLVVKDRLTLYSQRSDMPDTRTSRTQYAYKTVRGCPRAPVVLQMGTAILNTKLDVTVTGQVISWTPAVSLTTVTVKGAGDAFKWGIVTPPPGFMPPLTYGAVPAGAFVIPGATGGALARGDEVAVQGTTMEPNAQHVYSGTLVVP